MPKLADYVARVQQQEPHPALSSTQSRGAGSQAPAIAGEDFVGYTAASPAGPATSTCLGTRAAETLHSQSSADAPSAPWQSLHDRYVELYRRRIRDRGPRKYRHPDGSLRPEPPAADVFSQANRKHWTELVAYCRTHGGDREFDMQGFSLRYGIGVPHEAHRRLCEALDLQEELAPPPEVDDEKLKGTVLLALDLHDTR
ncbi:hypothetical protein Vafri_8421 [Volvox africanus]|nr:hypothetical protein Vafri_8421 [Volvox africanus]